MKKNMLLVILFSFCSVVYGEEDIGDVVLGLFTPIDLLNVVYVKPIDGCSATISTGGVYTALHCLSYSEANDNVDFIELTYHKDKIPKDSLPLCNTHPANGEMVIHVGYPGVFGMIYQSKIYGTVKYTVDENHFVTTAQIYQGMSGGAVVNDIETCIYGINESIKIDRTTGYVTTQVVFISNITRNMGTK